jgi:ribonuclease P protein subunit RPR2
MAGRRKKGASKKAFSTDIAEQRIARLFTLAKEAYNKDPALSNSYVDIARRISTRHRVSIPKELRRQICKNCGSYLLPGQNCRIRADGNNIIITCLNCGNIKRYPYK